jgi:hypothetical protein
MQRSHGVESGKQQSAPDSAREARAKVCSVQTSAGAQARHGHQHGKGKAMSATLIFLACGALVVCVAMLLAIVIFCACALASRADWAEQDLNEFLRRGSEPEMDYSTFPPTYKRFPRTVGEDAL